MPFYDPTYRVGDIREEESVAVQPLEPPNPGYIKVRALSYSLQNPDGTWTKPAKNTVMSCASGIMVILYDPKKDVIGLIEEFRLAAYFHDIENGVRDRPAGHILTLAMGAFKAGEALEEAVIREAFEETRSQVGRLWRGPQLLMLPSLSTDILTYYIAEFDSTKVLQNSAAGDAAEGENIKVHMMTADEVFKRCQKTDIASTFDALALAALLWFQNNRPDIRAAWTAEISMSQEIGPAKPQPVHPMWQV